ncbi:MAG TPA: CoA-binding protein [Burkholderiaceae bacterium]
MNQQQMRTALQQSKTIAVVGLSPQPGRASLMVAEYMQARGYRIVPVNPQYAGKSILGAPCYGTLQDAAAALKQEGVKIDIVNVFRRSEDVPPVADDAIAIGAPYLWMQMGIEHEGAAAKARAAGMQVAMDSCIKVDHAMLMR